MPVAEDLQVMQPALREAGGQVILRGRLAGLNYI